MTTVLIDCLIGTVTGGRVKKYEDFIFIYGWSLMNVINLLTILAPYKLEFSNSNMPPSSLSINKLSRMSTSHVYFSKLWENILSHSLRKIEIWIK